VVLFDSVFLSHSKTTNVKVDSFLNLQYILSAVINKLCNFDAWWTA